VNERFERATLPDVPDARLKELLTFVVIGAGPTGVELAAELYDMVYQDVSRMYPSRLIPFVSIKIIDLQEKIYASRSTPPISSNGRTSTACWAKA
jgi:NADH:ubiquinone reductase (non-electrogenic)